MVKSGNKLTVIELSCCYKTNFVKTGNYKIERYNKLQDLGVDKKFRVTKLYVEVSSLEVLLKNVQKFRRLHMKYAISLHKCYENDGKVI